MNINVKVEKSWLKNRGERFVAEKSLNPNYRSSSSPVAFLSERNQHWLLQILDLDSVSLEEEIFVSDFDLVSSLSSCERGWKRGKP